MATVCPLTLDILRSAWTADVPSPPHDALTPDERRRHLSRFPMSYLGVTRAPEDVGDDTTLTGMDLLKTGRQSLDRLVEADVFEPATAAGYFVYRLSSNGHTQTGVVCGVAVDDYDNGNVRIHEQIKPDRARHLANHLQVVGAQSSPIALAHRDSVTLQETLQRVVAADPKLDFVSRDKLRQQVWAVEDPAVRDRLEQHLGTGPLYIIDGHHRAAAAAWHRHDKSAGRSRRPGDDWMLAVIFPGNEMRNKAFHRVLDAEATSILRDRLSSWFPCREASIEQVVARRPGELAAGLAADDGHLDWLIIEIPEDPTGNPTVVDRLEPSRLADAILGPLLGLDESNPRGHLRYLPGTDDAAALSAVEISPGEAVFVMSPVSLDDLFAASDEGLVMPPKSTYFEPKVRSGLFVHFKDRI